MRSRLINAAVDLVRRLAGDRTKSAVRRSSPHGEASQRPARSRPRHDVAPPSADVVDDQLSIEYSPCLDGDPDPGEVVWTWVSYEDDASQGKDRPVVVIGRRGAHLLAVALTSKQHDNEAQVEVGRGPWDHEGRVSYAKIERLLNVDPTAVRREGAVLERQHFDDVVAGVRRAHRAR